MRFVVRLGAFTTTVDAKDTLEARLKARAEYQAVHGKYQTPIGIVIRKVPA